MRFFETLRSLDWILIVAALLLVLVSLAMLFSSVTSPEVLSSRFTKQAVAAVIGFVAAFVLARLPYHFYKSYALVFYGIGLAGLLTVFFLGQIVRGTVSRLEFFGFQLQPSEYMKVAIIITLAWLFAKRTELTGKLVVQSAFIIGIPSGLIIIEPDLGVAGIILALWGLLLVFLGLRWRIVIGMALASLVAFTAAWNWFFLDYQRARLLVFLDPTHDPRGSGYNILQSMVALGSGRIIGRGLGHGPQSQLQFLPERHTDFILASIGEELGFIGVAVIVTLYAIILWRLLHIARKTRDPFGQVIAVGTFILILVSLIVSAGMNMGLLPVTGIALPFLSYGGSNLVATFLLLGLVESVHVYSKWVQAPPRELEQLT